MFFLRIFEKQVVHEVTLSLGGVKITDDSAAASEVRPFCAVEQHFHNQSVFHT